ncbi:MAG: zf-HC2 domain-containing protein, partial [Acidimicrobiia bacterium]
MSAGLDGEAPAAAPEAVGEHLAGCPGCRLWAAAAQELLRGTRLAPAEAIPDQTAAILGVAAARGLLSPDPDGSRRRWRCALALVAVVQLALAAPSLLSGEGAGAPVHAAHELGSWDVALAVGFLFAAWRPARAWGMLPLVTALVACVVVTAGLDVAEGPGEAA